MQLLPGCLTGHSPQEEASPKLPARVSLAQICFSLSSLQIFAASWISVSMGKKLVSRSG